MSKSPAYNYEMVADAFCLWIAMQNNGHSMIDMHTPCREQLLVQIKNIYPDEGELSDDVNRAIQEYQRRNAKMSN